MRTIKYTKRSTSAKTIYVDVSRSDLQDILEQCQTIIDFDNECQKSNKIVSDIINRPMRDVIRQSSAHGGGYNTPRIAAEGIIENFRKGQFTLSKLQLPVIEKTFSIMNGILPDFWEVQFEESTMSYSEFQTTFNVKPPVKKEEPKIQSMIETFFDLDPLVESVTVTYRKKK